AVTEELQCVSQREIAANTDQSLRDRSRQMRRRLCRGEQHVVASHRPLPGAHVGSQKRCEDGGQDETGSGPKTEDFHRLHSNRGAQSSCAVKHSAASTISTARTQGNGVELRRLGPPPPLRRAFTMGAPAVSFLKSAASARAGLRATILSGTWSRR